MNIMTKWWISWYLYKDIHEYHDKMMITTIIDWLAEFWRWQKFKDKDKVQLYLSNCRGGVLLNYIFLGVFVEKVVICQLHPINQIPAAPRYRLCILRFLPTIHNFSFLKVEICSKMEEEEFKLVCFPFKNLEVRLIFVAYTAYLLCISYLLCIYHHSL